MTADDLEFIPAEVAVRGVLGHHSAVALSGGKVLHLVPHAQSNGQTATFDLAYADEPGAFGAHLASQNIDREQAERLRDALTAWLEAPDD